jgi:hypothetical protein
MRNKTINELTDLENPRLTDTLPIWDGTEGKTKKVSLAKIPANVITPVDSLPESPNILDRVYRYNNKYYVGNESAQTLTELASKADIPTVVNTVADGNMNPVTSNAVYDMMNTVTQGSATIVSSNVGATGEDCYVQFYKAGKIVMVRYRLYFNATPSFLEDIATGLPNAKAMNWPTCSNFLGQGSKPITWQANTDGVLRIDNGADNIVANSVIYGSFTYIAA